MNVSKTIGIAAALCITLISGITWTCGSSNPWTPAGYVGYITRGAVFGKATFEGLQTGPTSYGRGWMLNDPINVSITPTKVSEGFGPGSEILSADGLKLTFAIHIMFRVRPDQVRDLVEKYSTLHESRDKQKLDVAEVAFDQFVKEPLRTQARSMVEIYKAREVPLHFPELSTALTQWAKDYTKGTPFEVINAVVGNLQYPAEVSDAIAKKLAMAQLLEQKATEVLIAQKDAEKRIAEAEGMAKATAIIQQRLTPLYIQHEAIEAQKAMAGAPNHSIIYIPVGRNGVPLVSTVGTGKVE